MFGLHQKTPIALRKNHHPTPLSNHTGESHTQGGIRSSWPERKISCHRLESICKEIGTIVQTCDAMVHGRLLQPDESLAIL